MKIHVHQIPPEGTHIEGEEPAEILDLKAPETVPAGPIRYALDVGLSDGGLFATGELEVDMEAICVGCLEKFSFPLIVPDFAVQVELGGSEEIDLTDEVREDILLALPPHPRCELSGREQCPGVQRPPTAEPEGGESRPDVWGALDQLKIQ
jgi:uncharacterized metal-binding protein YceD (DUF177 family)